MDLEASIYLYIYLEQLAGFLVIRSMCKHWNKRTKCLAVFIRRPIIDKNHKRISVWKLLGNAYCLFYELVIFWNVYLVVKFIVSIPLFDVKKINHQHPTTYEYGNSKKSLFKLFFLSHHPWWRRQSCKLKLSSFTTITSAWTIFLDLTQHASLWLSPES